MADTGQPAFELVVAAQSTAPASARLFVGAVFDSLGRDEDAIHDAKLAVSEAVTLVVQAQSPSVTITITPSGNVSVGPIDDGTAAGLGWDVIQALYPQASSVGAIGFTVT